MQHWGLLRVTGIFMLCNHTVGMPGHQSLAVAVQSKLLLNSLVAVSALDDCEFQRDIVLKNFFLVCFVSLVG